MELLKNIFSFYLTYICRTLDILLLAFLMYKSYQILIKTQAVQLSKGALSMLLIYAVAFILRLNTLLWLLNTVATGFVIGAAIIFQPELRKMFLTMGQNDWFRGNSRAQHNHIDFILTAAERLSSERRGMLVVFLRQNNLKEIIDNPAVTRLNAEISSSLLITIFGHDTPLHDGAVIIESGKVLAAGCYLPLTKQQDINKSFGTRHRAALGIAEETDAVVLIVSEESGSISLAYDSKLYYDLRTKDIQSELEYLLNIKTKTPARSTAEGSGS
ncbi:MAG: diadenylate cyclase CdaA [Treponema sp.]